MTRTAQPTQAEDQMIAEARANGVTISVERIRAQQAAIDAYNAKLGC